MEILFQIFFYGIIFLFSISLVIFLHEWGHYIIARLCGVKVTKFSLGFGKEIIGKTDKKGMRWSLARWPIGGYVEIFGYTSAKECLIYDENIDGLRPLNEQEKKQAFCEKPLWKRASIVAAGPLANILLTFFILIAMYASIGKNSVPPIVAAVATDAPAYEAGFLPGDKILEMNGQPVERFEDVWEISFTPNAGLNFIIERNGKVLEKNLVSTTASYIDKKGIDRNHGRIGATSFLSVKLKDIKTIDGISVKDNTEKARELILKKLGTTFQIGLGVMHEEDATVFIVAPEQEINKALYDPKHKNHNFVYIAYDKNPYYVRFSPIESLWYSGAHILDLLNETKLLLGAIMLGRNNDATVGGFVTMGKITRKAVDQGFVTYLSFLAILSLQIALINLLPIPALDGGYLMFFAYEALRGKPLPQRIQDYALTFGVILLFALMIFANINDVIRAIL